MNLEERLIAAERRAESAEAKVARLINLLTRASFFGGNIPYDLNTTIEEAIKAETAPKGGQP